MTTTTNYRETAATIKLTSLSLLLILSLTTNGLPEASSVQVDLFPSPIQTVVFNSTATFQCSMNDSNYHLHWSIAYFHMPLSMLDIQFSNDRTIIRIVANMKELNESVISCGGQYEVNGPVIGTVSCMLLIQDHLSSVGDLSCNDHSRHCTWSAPFNLKGVYISHYTITVSVAASSMLTNDSSNSESSDMMITDDDSNMENNDTVIREFTTLNRSWVYCPYDTNELMEYSDTVIEVTVVPVNTLGLQGPPESTAFKGIGSNMSLSIAQLYKISPNLFAVDFEFSDEQLLQDCVTSVNARISDIHTKVSHNASQTAILLPHTIHTEFVIRDKRIWNVTIELYSRDSLLLSVEKEISSFDLQDLLITNPKYGIMCFECLFIVNTTTSSCLVKFEHSEAKEMNEIIISKTTKNESRVFACVSKTVSGGQYLIWAYDILINGTGQAAIPAITGRKLLVNGPPVTAASSHMVTPTIVVDSTSSISTSNPTNTNEKPFNKDLLLYIVVPVLITVLCLIFSFIFVLIILWRFRSRKKKILQIVGNQVPRELVPHLPSSLKRDNKPINVNNSNKGNAVEVDNNHTTDNIQQDRHTNDNTGDWSDTNDDDRSNAADSGISSQYTVCSPHGSRPAIKRVVPSRVIARNFATSSIQPSNEETIIIEETLV